jgi:uncharacterized surface protein with fasciclin (FAS1) repeats
MLPTRLILAATAAALLAAPALAQAPAAAPAAAPMAAPMTAKPVVMNGDLVDTLKLNGQFTIFTKALTDTNLAGLLKTNTNLTVFAPTDAAFAAMPAADLAKLQADKVAMQKFVLHHIVNAPIPSTKIKGAKGPIPSGAGDTILLDGSDEGGVMKVDGATIVQSDVKTGSGLLQVVDHVLIAGQGAVDPPAAPAADAAATAAAPR